MAAAAHQNLRFPAFKLKLGGDGDLDRVAAVRQAAPRQSIVVDGNEGIDPAELPDLLRDLAELGVALVEQPLPAGADDALRIGTRGHRRAEATGLRLGSAAVQLGGPLLVQHVMLRQPIGDDLIQDIVQRFLAAHPSGNATD